MDVDKNKEKGDLGENIVYNICFQMIKNGGLLYHSLVIPMDKDLPGNIKKDETGKNTIIPIAPNTEIDVLLVTRKNIFVIEVKTYRSNKIELKSDGIYGALNTDKNPVHQNEMHCRHIYPILLQALPEGSSSYIKPICVFTDKCKILDLRSNYEKVYMPIANLDTFEKSIKQLDTNNKYLLDINLIDNILSKYSSKKFERVL